MFSIFQYINITIIILSGIFLIYIFSRLYRKNKTKSLWFYFFISLGISVIMHFILRYSFYHIFSIFGPNTKSIPVIYISALFNELIKYFIILIFLYKKDIYKKNIDGIIYSVIIALGYLSLTFLQK